MEPGTEVYEGMIVGEHNRENDLTVNITKTNIKTNVRSATKDQTQTMNRPRNPKHWKKRYNSLMMMNLLRLHQKQTLKKQNFKQKCS